MPYNDTATTRVLILEWACSSLMNSENFLGKCLGMILPKSSGFVGFKNTGLDK